MLRTPGFEAADHAVLVTLEKGIARTEVLPNEAVPAKSEEALIKETLLLVIRDVDRRTAVILATEMEGCVLGGDQERALAGAKLVKQGAEDMMHEQYVRDMQRIGYHAEDLEPSVTRS